MAVVGGEKQMALRSIYLRGIYWPIPWQFQEYLILERKRAG